MVGQPAADEVGDPREQERQRGEDAAAEEREAEHLDQIGRQPREVEVQPVAEREVHRADRVQVAAAKERAPWRARAGVWLSPAFPSCWIHASSSRLTAGCSSGRSRYHANHAAAHTTPSRPKITKLARQPQRATISSAIGAESMPPSREPRNITPLARPRSRAGNQREKLRAMFGKAPASPRRTGTGSRRATANPRAAAGQHRERGPPEHDPRQHPARTLHVAEPARGDLEQRVRQRERAEHHAHLEDAEVQVLHDVGRGRRDADAIEVGDDGEQKREAENACANGHRHGSAWILAEPAGESRHRQSADECRPSGLPGERRS